MRPQIGIRELRDTLTATIRRVRAGETIEVTHDGVPVAVISPMPSDWMAHLVASGEVSTAKPLERPLRRFQVTGPLTASAALQEDRAEH